MHQANMPTESYLDMDKWSSDHASCENEQRFIIELLNTRSYEPRTSKKYDLLSGKIRVQLKQFEQSVTNLKTKLEEDFNITQEERERRYRLIENLESSSIQLAQKFHSRSGDEERRDLMASSRMLGESGTTGWVSDDDDECLDDNQPLLRETSQQIQSQQHRLLQEQEEGLDRLSKVISRQKDIAVTIGNEVDFQNELVDDLTLRMDRTNTSIQRETVHVQVVSRTDNTCGYWVVIMVLFVAIIIVVLL